MAETSKLVVACAPERLWGGPSCGLRGLAVWTQIVFLHPANFSTVLTSREYLSTEADEVHACGHVDNQPQ